MQSQVFSLRSIVVPVVGPYPDAWRLEFIERIAAAARARVTLVHVVGQADAAAVHDTAAWSLSLANVRASEREMLSAISTAVDQLRGHGLDATGIVERGEPCEMILRMTEALDADLIVMPRASPKSLEHTLLGSVGEHVLQHGRLPVLVLPAHAKRWDAALPVHVLVTLDGSRFAERALPFGTGLACLLQGDLHVLKVCGASEAPAAEEYLRSIAECPSTPGGKIVGAVSTRAPIGEAIRTYAREHHIGVITMATHGRGGLSRMLMGSVATEVLATASVPMLVVPREAQ